MYLAQPSVAGRYWESSRFPRISNLFPWSQSPPPMAPSASQSLNSPLGFWHTFSLFAPFTCCFLVFYYIKVSQLMQISRHLRRTPYIVMADFLTIVRRYLVHNVNLGKHALLLPQTQTPHISHVRLLML